MPCSQCVFVVTVGVVVVAAAAMCGGAGLLARKVLPASLYQYFNILRHTVFTIHHDLVSYGTNVPYHVIYCTTW